MDLLGECAPRSGGHSGTEIAVQLLRLEAPSGSHAAVLPRSRRAAHGSERRGETRSTPPLRPLMRAHRPSSLERPQQPLPTHRHGTTATLSQRHRRAGPRSVPKDQLAEDLDQPNPLSSNAERPNMMMKTDRGFAPAAYHRVLGRLPRTSDIDGPSWRMRAASSSGGHSGTEIAVQLLRLGAPSSGHAAVPWSQRAAHGSERRGEQGPRRRCVPSCERTDPPLSNTPISLSPRIATARPPP
jgi:hypothetical protein